MRADMRKWRFFGCTVFVLATAIALAIATTFLPDNSYERFQLLDGTIYSKSRWSYERMHFDPRPIDVAIVGDSKTAMGLSAAEIERQLAAAGKPVRVVNMSLEGDGRNQQWIFVQELLKSKHPKMIILAINDQQHPWGHDSFRYIAPASEIWREALHGLHDTKKNLMYLPFRQMRLFVAMFFPGPLGLEDSFDAVRYAATSPELPARRRSQAGDMIDMGQAVSREALLKQARDNAGEYAKQSRLPAAVRAVTDADDQVYTELIAHAAEQRGVKLLFVYQPGFNRPAPIVNRTFYERFGQVQDNVDLSDKDTLFHDWNHLNTAGTLVLSDRVANTLATMLP